MSIFQPRPKKKEGELEKTKQGLRLLKTTVQVGQSALARSPEKAITQLVVGGLKMAFEVPEIQGSGGFYDPSVNPLKLVDDLKTLGIGVLGWAPEALMATIDKKYHGWSDEQVGEAIEQFHQTGKIKTDVPQLVREKIYAIRVIATSNTAQNEWHIFEKIGGVFNNRIAQFGTVEPLSASECARTVAIIESIRPDEYSNEVKVYIATSCFIYGLYTVAPVKWLSFSEDFLQQANHNSTNDLLDTTLKNKIIEQYKLYQSTKTSITAVPEDLVAIQALKLLGINEYAEEVLL